MDRDLHDYLNKIGDKNIVSIAVLVKIYSKLAGKDNDWIIEQCRSRLMRERDKPEEIENILTEVRKFFPENEQIEDEKKLETIEKLENAYLSLKERLNKIEKKIEILSKLLNNFVTNELNEE